MTKKSLTLYINLLPLLIIVLLSLGAGYLLLADDIKLPKLNKRVEITRVEGYPTLVYTDEQVEKKRLVVKDEQTLNQFLNDVDPSGMLTLKDPIDFNKEYVLAVASETRPEEGHRIKIKKIYEDKNDKTLTVVLEETFPGKSCVVEKVSHVAVDIAKISKTKWKIEFERIKKIKECN